MPDTVLLVHGLWLHGVVMRLMARRIARCGYAVHTFSYPTVRSTLTQNAARLAEICRERGGKLHFVGHSMGGLVALEAARRVPKACRGRVVMVGTPYGDSFAARCLARWPGGGALLGRSMGEWLAATAHSPPVECEIGVIAGTGGKGLGRLVAPRLPVPNDGVIALSETMVPGMRDHIAVPVSHTAMIASRVVAHQICAFLQYGEFDRAALTPA
jgi:pimeloyl-ACP methyl ester carboxylesterase